MLTDATESNIVCIKMANVF